MDQPGKVANPARGQLNRENDIPENMVSRDGFGSPVDVYIHTNIKSDFRIFLVRILTGGLTIGRKSTKHNILDYWVDAQNPM